MSSNVHESPLKHEIAPHILNTSNELQIDSNNQKPWFNHPCSRISRVYTILDPCHKIKLVRNAWAKLKTLYILDTNGELQKIDFNLIEMVNDFQQLINMRLKNKLTSKHLNFQNNVMNVKLASQLFSRSVADSMIFCKENQVPGFKNCNPTVTFIKNMNDIFDSLNAREIGDKAIKAQIRPCRVTELKKLKEYHEIWKTYLDKAKTCL